MDGKRKTASITLFSFLNMSNGCGCQNGLLKYIKPPYAKKYYAACVLHDYEYDKGGGEEQRKEADTNLFLNMQKVSIRQSRNPYALTWFTLIALLYYISTRLFGRYYFNYDTPHHS